VVTAATCRFRVTSGRVPDTLPDGQAPPGDFIRLSFPAGDDYLTHRIAAGALFGTIPGVDWRTRLRKLVNREGHLGPVRLGLLRLIDPVEWYMRRNDQQEERRPRRRRARNPVGWTAYTPLSWSSSQSAQAPLGAVLSEQRPEEAERGIEDYQKRLHGFRQEHATLLEEKARELLSGNQIAIVTSAGTVRAKLVRFRNGAVLEQWHTSPLRSGHGMRRVERRNPSDVVPLIVDYLTQTVLGLGPDPRPLP
jgi:hypothetical protein